MSSNRMLAAASLCISIAASLFADTRLDIQHSEPGKQPQAQSIMIAAGKMRMEQGAMSDTVMIYHQATNTFYMVQPSKKSYMELDPEKMGEMMDQASQMQQQMMAQLEEQLKDLPEDQRKQMREMMSQRGMSMPGMKKEPVRYERRGSDSAGGFSCNWVDAYQGDRKVRELCLADPGSLGVASADTDTMLAMRSSMQAFAERFGRGSMFQDDMPDGIPIHVRHYDDNGNVSMEQLIQGVSHDGIDASMFEIPAGYNEQELPTLPQR